MGQAIKENESQYDHIIRLGQKHLRSSRSACEDLHGLADLYIGYADSAIMTGEEDEETSAAVSALRLSSDFIHTSQHRRSDQLREFESKVLVPFRKFMKEDILLAKEQKKRHSRLFDKLESAKADLEAAKSNKKTTHERKKEMEEAYAELKSQYEESKYDTHSIFLNVTKQNELVVAQAMIDSFETFYSFHSSCAKWLQQKMTSVEDLKEKLKVEREATEQQRLSRAAQTPAQLKLLLEKNALFGTSLQTALLRDKAKGIDCVVPIYVRKMVSWVIKYGLKVICFFNSLYPFSLLFPTPSDLPPFSSPPLAPSPQEEGIFRISGNQNHVKEWTERIDRGESIELILDPKGDPHLLCTLLKQYLRELPEPLCTTQLYKPFLEFIRVGADKREVSAIRELLLKLPSENYYLFREYIMLCSDVITHQSHNKMSASNMGTVMAPNIFPCGDFSMEEMKLTSDLLGYLSNNYKEIFEESPQLLIQAIQIQEVNTLRELLRTEDLDANLIDPETGNSALNILVAIETPSLDCLQLLVDKGADVNKVGRDGLPPAFRLVSSQSSPEKRAALVRLIELGAKTSEPHVVGGKKHTLLELVSSLDPSFVDEVQQAISNASNSSPLAPSSPNPSPNIDRRRALTTSTNTTTKRLPPKGLPPKQKSIDGGSLLRPKTPPVSRPTPSKVTPRSPKGTSRENERGTQWSSNGALPALQTPTSPSFLPAPNILLSPSRNNASAPNLPAHTKVLPTSPAPSPQFSSPLPPPLSPSATPPTSPHFPTSPIAPNSPVGLHSPSLPCLSSPPATPPATPPQTKKTFPDPSPSSSSSSSSGITSIPPVYRRIALDPLVEALGGVILAGCHPNYQHQAVEQTNTALAQVAQPLKQMFSNSENSIRNFSGAFSENSKQLLTQAGQDLQDSAKRVVQSARQVYAEKSDASQRGFAGELNNFVGSIRQLVAACDKAGFEVILGEAQSLTKCLSEVLSYVKTGSDPQSFKEIGSSATLCVLQYNQLVKTRALQVPDPETQNKLSRSCATIASLTADLSRQSLTLMTSPPEFRNLEPVGTKAKAIISELHSINSVIRTPLSNHFFAFPSGEALSELQRQGAIAVERACLVLERAVEDDVFRIARESLPSMFSLLFVDVQGQGNRRELMERTLAFVQIIRGVCNRVEEVAGEGQENVKRKTVVVSHALEHLFRLAVISVASYCVAPFGGGRGGEEYLVPSLPYVVQQLATCFLQLLMKVFPNE